MRITHVANWEAFENEVSNSRSQVPEGHAELLFRGLPDSRMELSTTLERKEPNRPFSLEEYHHLVVALVRPAVETFTGTSWAVADWSQKLEDALKNTDRHFFDTYPGPQLYPYLVYLRHHGFPSPLLDWTKSVYVAAFFAFKDVLPLAPESRRAIYVYVEPSDKTTILNQPVVRSIGTYVRGHARHFRQQSNYTICARPTENGWIYTPHDALVSPGPAERREGVMTKWTIPSTERTTILHLLEEYNINAYSLFGSEESLMDTMWMREYELGKI
jgi:hypothetical protein